MTVATHVQVAQLAHIQLQSSLTHVVQQFADSGRAP